jgi:phosphohistidine phosphatase
MSSSRQLFVLRHAKSSWDDPGLDDHERPLAPRGRRSVELLAKHLVEMQIRPAQVLCSSARRTVETFEGVAPGGELSIEPELYAANGDAVLARLQRVSDRVPSVMLIGHNPALQILVLRLTGANGEVPQDADLAEVQRKFPTGALASLSFDCPWSELRQGSATLQALLRPRDLHRS